MVTRMNENLRLLTLLVIVACGCSTAPEPVARSGAGETRLGKIEFERDYVTEATAAKLREELKFQAAVQTFLWSFPLANVMGLRDGHRAVGITNTSIPIFEDFLTPKTVVPTGNQSTVYAYNVLTLGAEPIVLEVIPDVVGFIGDAWQHLQNYTHLAVSHGHLADAE